MKVLKKVISAAVSRQSLILLASVCVFASVLFSGCPEAQQMMTPVVSEPTDTAAEPTDPTIVVGEKEETPATEPEPEVPKEVETPVEPAVPTVPLDTTHPNFTGKVLMPDISDYLRRATRAVAGATLTIASGPRAGEAAVTDTNGRYAFPHIAGETLHLQVEKGGFEPKAVIVHRSEPTMLADGTPLEIYGGGPQSNPGTILIGHRWPDAVRFILEETPLPPDLLLVRVDFISEKMAGFYGPGLVVVEEGNCLLHTISHELGHAYQHAVAIAHIGPHAEVGNWNDTPGGKAYAEARQKDWDEVGKSIDDGGHFSTLIEDMANTASDFWNIRGKFDTPLCFDTQPLTEEDRPNRLWWAQEWLGKK